MTSDSNSNSEYHVRLESLAKYIQSQQCKKIVLMLGAGVSTSAGIPDFRSPETGLYANLARLKLPYPEAVFEINFFKNNPEPFYTLAHELYPGKYRPTPTHSFIRLLADKGLLSMCLTQNIDTLERRAGVPSAKIIEAHGSFAEQRCVQCKTPFDDAKMKEMVMNFGRDKKVPRCERKKCGGLVKPDIVFFGESLPPEFMAAPSAVYNADLLIVMGTSLTVHPFASLASRNHPSRPRVLINLDLVGDFYEPNDAVLLGKCDDVVKDLCRALGWEEELDRLWDDTAASLEVGSEEAAGEKEPKTEVQDLQKEVEDLTKKIQEAMALHNQDTKDKEENAQDAKEGTKLEGKAEEVSKGAQEETEKDEGPTGTTTTNPSLPIQGTPLEDSAAETKSELPEGSAVEKSDEDTENKEKL
ncbi:Sir2 histone deacetylase Hst2 [Marasmius sp. AFHP31]|nr:Sir2 histone deacetylase Hst2 [Marasmius sp. AFHP31]